MSILNSLVITRCVFVDRALPRSPNWTCVVPGLSFIVFDTRTPSRLALSCTVDPFKFSRMPQLKELQALYRTHLGHETSCWDSGVGNRSSSHQLLRVLRSRVHWFSFPTINLCRPCGRRRTWLTASFAMSISRGVIWADCNDRQLQ